MRFPVCCAHTSVPIWYTPDVYKSQEIVDVVSLIQLEKRTDLEEIDFLISTVPLENITIPCILVSAVMSDADIRNIQDTVSANWLEEKLSLKYFRKQYERGKLELHTVDRFDGSIFKHRSPFEETKTAWGHCLWTVIGINTEDRTSIYRREEESDLWYLVTHACKMCIRDSSLLSPVLFRWDAAGGQNQREI